MIQFAADLSRALPASIGIHMRTYDDELSYVAFASKPLTNLGFDEILSMFQFEECGGN